MNLKHFGEFKFIDLIAPLCSLRKEGVIKGIGDDCAVVELDNSRYLLVTTDLMIERIHFSKSFMSPEALGRKALSINVSDIAACGGVPRDAFISIAVPEDLDIEYLQDFYRGIRQIALEHEVNVLGGDTTGSKADLVINITLTGVVKKTELLLRNNAKSGDLICITGTLGDSSAGLAILQSNASLPHAIESRLINAHCDPRAQVLEGRLLAQSGACNAAIDISDGLSSDLAHICKQSDVGATIYESKLPMSDELKAASKALNSNASNFALNGGEDYVLMAAVKLSQFVRLQTAFQENGSEIYAVGEFTDNGEMKIVLESGEVKDLVRKGWDHFR